MKYTATIPMRPAKPDDLKYICQREDGKQEWRVHFGLVFFMKVDEKKVSGPHYLIEEIYQDHSKIKELLDSGNMLLIEGNGNCIKEEEKH